MLVGQGHVDVDLDVNLNLNATLDMNTDLMSVSIASHSLEQLGVSDVLAR